MERRADVGHMDFKWERPEQVVDHTSPFAQLQARRSTTQPTLTSTKPSFPTSFNSAAKQSSPLRMHSFHAAPSRSLFSPSLAKQASAPSFRATNFTNPAFSTPRDNRLADIGMDDSPALTDVSEIAETPDFDRSDLMDGLTLETPEQPDTTRRVLWSDKRSGKGALPRPSAGALGWSDNRVRKRQRADRDRDIGSTRSRLPGGCDEDDSDYEDSDDERSSPRKLKYKKPKEQMGWFHYIISAVSANPDAPIILSYYIQLLVDGFLASLLLWVAWCAFSSARGEVIYSAEKAKTAMLEEITQCRRQFLDNKCSPISSRMPALESLCNEWDACMNQDPDNVAGVKASVGHLADIINEFTTRLSWKSIFVILMVVVAVLFANNMAFSKLRQNVRDFNHHQPPAGPVPSQPALGFPLSPEKSNQAYIFAPIGQTPRHLRHTFFEDTDSDASPSQQLLQAPKTPSRQSPLKYALMSSPSKRSPSKRH